jgi:cation:H+ antiporter
VTSQRSGRGVRELVPESGYRVELRFLAVASVVAFVVPLTGQINLLLGFALLGFFAFYLWKASRNEAEAPELVGPAAHLGVLPARAPAAGDRHVLVSVLLGVGDVGVIAEDLDIEGCVVTWQERVAEQARSVKFLE